MWKKSLSMLLLFLLSLFIPLEQGHSAEIVANNCPNNQFYAEYFAPYNYWDAWGTPVATQCEPAINYAWQQGGPTILNGHSDRFGIRWQGQFQFTSGTYQFHLEADDGLRVWIDGESLFADWTGGPKEQIIAKTMSSGLHTIRVEYFEYDQGATAKVQWYHEQECGIGRFFAQYYANYDWEKYPPLTRCEESINYDWGLGSPDPAIPNDLFTVQWQGAFLFNAGNYQFHRVADDTLQLWLNGTEITNWVNHVATVNIAQAGAQTLRVRFREARDSAVAKLFWVQETTCPVDQLHASYYNNVGFSGLPVRTACESKVIDYDWGTGSLGPGLNSDLVSIIWKGQLQWGAGRYRFAVSADDRIKITVDGDVIMDTLNSAPQRNQFAERQYDSAGLHQVEIRYAEYTEGALVRVGLYPLHNCPTGQWSAEYFANTDLTGNPNHQQCETEIAGQWREQSPGFGLPADKFGVRWWGSFPFATGNYQFYAHGDDHLRVWLDGAQLFDGAIHQQTVARQVTQGTRLLELHYADLAGLAWAEMLWHQKLPQYYVAPNGNDANVGSLESPLRTLDRAREVARVVTAGGMSADLHIQLRGGQYPLTKAVEFRPEDSGKDGFTIHYENYPNETPVLQGARPLTDWVAQADGSYRAFIGVGQTISTLWENEQRGILARTPNSGYLYTMGAVSGDPVQQARAFMAQSADLPNLTQLDGLRIYIWPYKDWDVNIIPVTALDRASGRVELGASAIYTITAKNRYYWQGAQAFLDSAGEFYVDSAAGYVYYRPRQTPIAQQTILIPTTTTLINLGGEWSATAGDVHNLTFEGLVFDVTDFVPTHYDWPDIDPYQTESANYAAMVYATNTKNISLIGNRFLRAGSNVIRAPFSNQNLTIRNNLLQDFGYNGVHLSGYKPGDGPFTDLASSHANKQNVIENNLIVRGGQTLGHGNGVLLNFSGENQISHNKITGMPRSGIVLHDVREAQLIGRTIYGVPINATNQWELRHSRNNLVQYNDVSDLLGHSEDGGGIVLWGAGKGNTIKQNRVHHYTSDLPNGLTQGIYLDDESSYTTVTHNIVYGLWGELVNPLYIKGSYNIINNNIIANNVADWGAYFWAYNGGRNDHLTLTRNIFYSENGMPAIYRFADWDYGLDKVSVSDYNTFAQLHGQCQAQITHSGKVPTNYSWAQWRALGNNKYDQNSVCYDVEHPLTTPLFVDAANNNYHLVEGAIPLSKGFEQIDQARIGLSADFPFWSADEPVVAEKPLSASAGIINDGTTLTASADNQHIAYKVDFGSGDLKSVCFRLAVKNDKAGQTIELRLSSPTGALLTTVRPLPTGGREFLRQCVPLEQQIAGVQTVYIVFRGTRHPIALLDSLQFSAETIARPLIHGTIWRDMDKDEQKGSADVGIGNVSIQLLAHTGEEIFRTTTNNQGVYQFGQLPNVLLNVNQQGLLREYWLNVNGGLLTDLTRDPRYPNNPSGTHIIPISAVGRDWSNQFGTRIRGYLVPPSTGSYQFCLASDYQGEFWLSSDANPANKQSRLAITTYQYDCAVTTTTITLRAGERYYLELLHKAGGQGDILQLGWKMPGQSADFLPIPSTYLIPFNVQNSTPRYRLQLAESNFVGSGVLLGHHALSPNSWSHFSPETHDLSFELAGSAEQFASAGFQRKSWELYLPLIIKP